MQMHPQGVPHGAEHAWVCNTHTAIPRALVSAGTDLNCVMRVAKGLQGEAPCLPWTLTQETCTKLSLC